MNVFAPNLTVLIGSLTAAQLINHCGGLAGLAKTPACNIAPLGSKKAAGVIGMATNVGDRHQGFLYHSPGKEEKEVGYGTGDTTRQKTRAKLSKKNAGWGGDTTFGSNTSLQSFGAAGTSTALRGSGLRAGGVGAGPGGGAGTSSIAFTPVQGLELVDPKMREEMSRKRKAEDDRWFKGGTFTQLGTSTTKVDAGGFKVPALPKKSRQE